MKKASTFLAFLLCGIFAAHGGYMYWLLEPEDASSPVEFAYAQVAADDGNGAITYLTVGNTSSTIVFDQSTIPNTTSLAETYSLLPSSPESFSYYVELYNQLGEVVGMTKPATYAQLRDSFALYDDKGTAGILAPFVYTAAAVPEPTSGMLLALGLGLLALRRRRAAAFLAAAAMCGAALAAANDTVVSFSTPGVDRYADGTRVMQGESYALVWTADGATFGGLSADCTPLAQTDKVVMVAPLAKRGRCPVTVVEINAEDAKSYEGGTFAVYLLDTRVKGADGKVTLAAYANGLPRVVNSFGASGAEKDATSAAGVAGGIGASAAIRLGDVGVYTQIESPQITAIEIRGAKIRLQVKGMSPAAEYFVVPGSTPGSFAQAMDAEADEDGFTFDRPEDRSATFFKVIGVRKFDAAKDAAK